MSHKLLNELNDKMRASLFPFEDLYWLSHMGDHSVDDDFVKAEAGLTAFRANRELSARVDAAIIEVGHDAETLKKLRQWQRFFSCYQTPAEFLPLRTKIAELEAKVAKGKAEQIEGYVNPATGEFVKASKGKMRAMIQTHDDESIRKACFEALEKFSVTHVAELAQLVEWRNEYARALGYENFYAYKLWITEGMTTKELFSLCDELYQRTKYGFKNVREMENGKPGLRLPWNFGYMLVGDLTKKQDPYMQFGDALMRWGRSFAALCIDYQGAILQLDLLDREGKYNNGFCHWPRIVYFKDGVRVPGACNFTANAVPGQVGAGATAHATLFHEGGHAAHLTNVETTEACMNTEFAPQSVAWAETHSMFLDVMQTSVEWMTRYARDAAGNSYPFELFEEEARRTAPIMPLDAMSYLRIVNFERELYETADLTEEKILEIARRVYRAHHDMAIESFSLLSVPHIYSWESSAYYHGYLLATLALYQWREYFFNKYGYIVDNPRVGPEMREVWKLGASKTFAEFVELATGNKLSSDAYLSVITASADETIQIAQDRIVELQRTPSYMGPIKLNATIRMVDGKDIIADSAQGFEVMAEKYRAWVLNKEAH